MKLQQQETRVAETRQAYEEAEKSTEADRKAVETLDKKINKIKYVLHFSVGTINR